MCWHSGGEENAGGEQEWKTRKHQGQFECLDSPTLETWFHELSHYFYFKMFLFYIYYILGCFHQAVKSGDRRTDTDCYPIDNGENRK